MQGYFPSLWSYFSVIADQPALLQHAAFVSQTSTETVQMQGHCLRPFAYQDFLNSLILQPGAVCDYECDSYLAQNFKGTYLWKTTVLKKPKKGA